jgi:hypothetical protein
MPQHIRKGGQKVELNLNVLVLALGCSKATVLCLTCCNKSNSRSSFAFGIRNFPNVICLFNKAGIKIGMEHCATFCSVMRTRKLRDVRMYFYSLCNVITLLKPHNNDQNLQKI